MKAILVVDMPMNCYECSLCAEEVIYGKTEFVCKGYGSIIESLDGNDWCPLRPLPSQMEYNDNLWTSKAEEEYYKEGWNRFYETITGETE